MHSNGANANRSIVTNVSVMSFFLQVLFQNDSPASLLARVMGIIGSIDHEMLRKGRDSHKYFTKNRMLYERNQVSGSSDLLNELMQL